MTTSTMCPVCEAGNLTELSELQTVEFAGKKGSVEYRYSVCDCCGSEQADTTQVRFNKREMTAFKKQAQRLLPSHEVKRIRLKFGLTQADAAEVFGGGPVAFSKYENNDVIQSDTMNKMLRLADDMPEVVPILMGYAGLKPDPSFKRDIIAAGKTVRFAREAMKSTMGQFHSLSEFCAAQLSSLSIPQVYQAEADENVHISTYVCPDKERRPSSVQASNDYNTMNRELRYG